MSDPYPPTSLVELAFIALVALVTGLLAANYIWRDVRYRRAPAPSLARRLAETILGSAWLAFAAGAAACMVCVVISLTRVHPWVAPAVLLGLYGLMAVHVAWNHFQRTGGVLSALLDRR